MSYNLPNTADTALYYNLESGQRVAVIVCALYHPLARC